MKKIAELTENIRLVGQAEKDGVAFRAQRCKGPGVNPIGTLATVQENSNIICTSWDEENFESQTHAKLTRSLNTTFWIAGILGIAFLSAYFAIDILSRKSYEILFSMAYIMIGFTYIAEGIGILICRIFGNKEVISFSKFLAAKNAIQNAYYDLGKLPDLDEVKHYSTISYDNDYITSRDATLATFWIGLMIVHPLPSGWNILGLLVTIVIIFTLGKNNKLIFWRFLLVSKPEDIHYKAAITALEECIRCIDFIVQDTVSITTDLAPNFTEEKCKACSYYYSCKEHLTKKH